MGICTQDLCEFAVEIFVQNTGFDGQVLGWDACSKNLQLNGTFDLEKLIEHYAGAILENCGESKRSPYSRNTLRNLFALTWMVIGICMNWRPNPNSQIQMLSMFILPPSRLF